MKDKLIFCLFLGGLLICCGGKQESRSASQSGSSEKPEAGGNLLIGISGEPRTLNPLLALSKTERNMISLIYRRLADINADLVSFSPQLAKNWHFSGDSLTLIFDLRRDITWHDGHIFSAADVVYTYTMQTNPQVAWDGIAYKQNIERVQALNDSTVAFYFTKRYPNMLMDAAEGYIIPEHIWSQVDVSAIHTSDYNHNPIGCGPFVFQQWAPQQRVILKGYENYYQSDLPYLERIIFRIIPDKVSICQQLLSEDLDFMESMPPRNFANLRKDWQKNKTPVRPVSYLGRQYDFIGWNLLDRDHYHRMLQKYGQDLDHIADFIEPHPLFGSQKVRAALTMAIDRQALCETVNYNMAVPLHGPIPIILDVYNATANVTWEYDPGKAQKYLKAAGWTDSDGDGILDKNGRPFAFEMLTNSGDLRRKQALTIIQQQLKKVKIKMIPRLVEGRYLVGDLLPNRKYDAILFGWNVGLKMDLTPLFGRSSFFIPFHFTGYYSTRYDSLATLVRQSTNRATRQNYYNQIAHHLSDELPYTWLYYEKEATGLHSRIKNARFDRRGAYINLEKWWIPTEQQFRTLEKSK